jgi:hypothetical protein
MRGLLVYTHHAEEENRTVEIAAVKIAIPCIVQRESTLNGLCTTHFIVSPGLKRRKTRKYLIITKGNSTALAFIRDKKFILKTLLSTV